MLVDLLHLSRNLQRSRASALAAVLTLSLTLGAGASIFAVVDAVLITPPPFMDPESLVVLGDTLVDEPTDAPRTVRYAAYEAWCARAGSMAVLEASDGTNLTLTELGAAERISAMNVTPGFFPLLGVRPALGRLLEADDVGRRIAIISHAFWRGKLGEDPAVIGRELVLGGQTHTVVGVMPEQLSLAFDADVWRPFPVTPSQIELSEFRVRVMARLSTGVSPASLAAALDDVSRTSSPPTRVVVTPIATDIAGHAQQPLVLLLGAAALAVLIGFIDLAGLLMVRSIDRRRELAVRSALGARKSEIAKQLLLEAEALVAIGIAGGVLLAAWLTPAVGVLALEQFGGSANRELAVSWRVVGVLAVVGAVCAAICGALPAVVAAQRSLVDVLRPGATLPRREQKLRRGFVIGQVALAFVLLVSVTLVGRSLLHLLAVDPGFDRQGVMVFQIALPSAVYPNVERVVTFYSNLHRALEERLGMNAVGTIDEIPLTHDRGRTLVREQPTEVGREAVAREAGPDYFAVLRVPVVAGRAFDERDTAPAARRVVVSESLAQRLFASGPAVGRRIWLGSETEPAEVIGVTGDVKHRALDERPLPTVYLAGWQTDSRGRHVLVRSARPEADVTRIVREEVAKLDRNLPVYATRSLLDVVAASPGLPARWMLTATFLGFALLAVILSATGLFGVVAHDVAARRTELAVRIALGASPSTILAGTLRQGVMIVGGGLALGSVLSIWTARALGEVVFGTAGLDVVTMGAPALLLLGAGLCAVLPAARRAVRTDPITALRGE
jgi:putative ABC transport system permease protein